MIIKKRRIRSLNSIRGVLAKYNNIIIGISIDDKVQKRLVKIGFTSKFEAGETVLPSAQFGPVSSFNAEGKDLIHRDQQMEKVYRVGEWKWKEWCGRYDTIERTKFVDIPYKRYPRTFIAPPSVELTISEGQNGTKLIASPTIGANDVDKVIHVINLFLEIFGECQILDPKMDETISSVRRLNWTILPQGRMPWSLLKKAVEKIIEETPKGNRSYLEHRLELINRYKPDFTAVGNAGFHGYIIMGFTDKNLFVLESPFYGNATYILENNWEELSQKTKAEIINANLCKYRLIHKDGWDLEISKLL